jgi:SWI/SNF-related matrix-associated actin-dependent regulator 1 of chromatin subfamily A
VILDFNPQNKTYILKVRREERDPRELMREFGLDFSVPASTTREAVLFTLDPYAATSFYPWATPAARSQLGYIMEQVALSWAGSSNRHIDVPSDKELWPFQKAGADYAMNHEHTLIGDDMGLGKTMQAVAIANEMQAKRVLVVCPAAIRFQWVERIHEWSTMNCTYKVPNDLIYAITSSRYGVHGTAAWTVVSWDLIRHPALWRALAKTEYDLLILDEAHYAKTIDAKRTRALFGGGREHVAEPLASRARKVVALTGTPLPNRPREAYTLARGLCWESIDFMSEDAFRERFNPSQQSRTEAGKLYIDEREGRLAELQNRMRAHFMVRRLEIDVMKQLKRPVYDLIRVEETTAIKQALQAESLLGIDPENLEGADAKVFGQIATARRLMGVAMAPQVVQWVKMLLDGGGRKLVLFAWHKEVLDILCAGLAEYGIIRVDGSDSGKGKHEKVQQFIREPSANVIVGNVLSLGTGTDGLQHVSTHALLAEPDWVFGNNEQCIKRLHRGGQTGQVQADIFVAPGSLSEKVLASALRKGSVVFKALDRRVA